MPVTSVQLNDKHEMPQLGLGTGWLQSSACTDIVSKALEFGWRSIDTAEAYGNEREIGDALSKSSVDRSELFITTKLWDVTKSRDGIEQSLNESLERLQLDYVDLYLLHWPQPRHNRFVHAWEALMEMRESGRVKSIGVSNFTTEHLQVLIDRTGMVPAVNQVELHPGYPQKELRTFHANNEIATAAWSPLSQGGELLRDDAVVAIADEVNRSTVQLILRWHLQLGNVAIPKTSSQERLVENFDVFDFEITPEQMNVLSEIEGEPIGPLPDDNHFA